MRNATAREGRCAARERPASSLESTMIGIDVAKDTLAVCWWPAGESEAKWERAYPNSKAGLRRSLKDTPPEEPWVLEPTGPYSLGVVEAALEAGRKPRQADP